MERGQEIGYHGGVLLQSGATDFYDGRVHIGDKL